nr:uncharacterized protein LOC105844038 [Hydra vulgaris]
MKKSITIIVFLTLVPFSLLEDKTPTSGVNQNTDTFKELTINSFIPCATKTFKTAADMIANCSIGIELDVVCVVPPCPPYTLASPTQCIYFYNVFNYPTGAYCAAIAEFLLGINNEVSYSNCCS